MRSKRLIVAAIVLVVIGAVGAFAYRLYLNPARDTAIDLVPSDAVVYGSLFLSPSTHQKQALGALLKHFPQASTPELAKSELERLLDGALASNGIDFTHDVEPWIGRQVAFFIETGGSDPPADALLIATRDPDAANTSLAKAADAMSGPEPSHLSYRGIDYISTSESAAGVVGNFAVVASSSQEFENVVTAHDGMSLGDRKVFQEAIAPLPHDRVGTLYFDTSRIASLSTGAAGSASPPPAPSLFESLPPIAVGAFLRSDSIVFDVAIQRSGSPSNPSLPKLLGDLPSNTWAALEIPSLGQGVARG
ncbi:MAG: DUF3352 domain-containing protein, partial [Actinomycetota bacterium]